MAVGANRGDRHHLAHVLVRLPLLALADEGRVLGAMATGAVVLVDRHTPGGESRVDGIEVGEGHGLRRLQPLGGAQKAVGVDRRRVGAGAEGGVEVALGDAVVVAVPVQRHLHVFPRSLVPDRGEIGETRELGRIGVRHVEIEERLVGAERIVPARAPAREIDEAQALRKAEGLLAHPIHGDVAEDQPIDQVGLSISRWRSLFITSIWSSNLCGVNFWSRATLVRN